MNNIVATTLLRNWLNRIVAQSDGTRHLPGLVTEGEYQALKYAIGVIDSLDGTSSSSSEAAETSPSVAEELKPSGAEPRIHQLDMSILDMKASSPNARLCLDFGTAMSKATLVRDEPATDLEQISVLKLGIPGDQEQISETMLISSVYIDNAGLLWFGKAADDRSRTEEGEGRRQRLDNIKRRLSEDGLNDLLGPRLNPTGLGITYRDMILAYLTYFTWTVNSCLRELGYSRNVARRYAMPCLPGDKRREVSHELNTLIGQSQILADSFGNLISEGLPLTTFLSMANTLRGKKVTYPFVLDDLTEPLGVAGSLLSWKRPADMLMMVVDVGAGTSDLSLYRIALDPTRGVNSAVEVKGAARGITEAGNYLDRVLVELVMKRAGITTEHPRAIAIRGKLELDIRDLKETLFNEKSLLVVLDELEDIEIHLDEFLGLDAVVKFGESLQSAMQAILLEVDQSFVNWILANPRRYLIVAATGGGAKLPMVSKLTQGTIRVGDKTITVQPALPFPAWLNENYPELEEDYPRIAVSLGGARKRVIVESGAASVTAGDLIEPPQLDRYAVTGPQTST